MFKLNLKSEFLKHVMVLMTGTMLAQIFGYILAPLITRLYTPEDNGDFGIYLRIIGVGAALATLRFENALPLPKRDDHSFRLYRIAYRFIIATTCVAFIMAMVFSLFELKSWLYYLLIPFGIFFTAYGNLGTNWALRTKKFRTISLYRISNSLGSGIARVIFGFFKMGYLGLILGTLLGFIVSSFWFIRDFRIRKKEFPSVFRSKRNIVLAREYSDFPKINLPHVLVDLGKDLLIAILFLEMFTKSDFGLYDHAYRMMRIPLVLIGGAIGQVFFQKCAEMRNDNQNFTGLIRKSVYTLCLLSIVPFSIIFFFGEEIFSFVFGDLWGGAGTFAEIMSFWLMMNFIYSPLSTLPLILNRQKEFFMLGLINALTMCLTIFIPAYFFDTTLLETMWILSLSQGCFQIFLIFLTFRYSKRYFSHAN